jgi:hypothetical protein
MSTPTIAVVQTTYKRAHRFQAQHNAIKAQTVPIAERFVFSNTPEVESRLILPSSIEATHVVCNRNLGVWPRFLLAMECKSEFVCIFDDDTVPGSNWLKNCLDTFSKQEALIGSAGVVFSKGGRGPKHFYGWKRPHDKAVEVDIVGHAWFFKRDWLRYYALEPRCGGPTCGEDYHFSYVTQKHLKIPTLAAAHPVDDVTMWGSIQSGWGRDRNALYRQKGEDKKKDAAHAAYRAAGWRTLYERDPVKLQEILAIQ